jgi:hypothetical protein
LRRGGASRVDRLSGRLDVLRELRALAPGRVPAGLEDRIRTTVAQADARLGHGSAHTVVAVAGATGSGKSSLLNALVGSPVATVGVRRPTTSTAQAAVFGGGADALLDWLVVPGGQAVPAGVLDGLVLLDLPDHDSVEAGHRSEVDRLVEVVDTFLWVADPQKYADAALHHGYLARFAAHAEVTIVALNKIDTVAAPEDLRSMVDDLGRLLAGDGLSGVRVIPTSTVHGDGLDALRRELGARVAEREALVARLDADVDWLVDDVRAALGDTEPAAPDRDVERRLVDGLAFAAGVDALAEAVGAAHRHRSVQRVGWPPVRWVRRLRPDPLRRLGLDRGSTDRSLPGDEVVGRTSRPRASAVADAAVDDALRAVVTSTSHMLPELWAERIRGAATDRRDGLEDALDVAVASARLPTAPPRWWAVASALQWLATAVMVGGLLWLLVLFVVAWLQLPDPPTPQIGALPWPTVLALGGAGAGLLLAVVSRWFAAVGGRRRARAAARHLQDQVAEVARTSVLGPLAAEVEALRTLRQLGDRLQRGP